MYIGFVSSLIVVCIGVSCTLAEKYEPTWASLDSRPLPSWFDESKFGVMVVWGVYSVPSFKSEWFWELWARGRQDIVDFMKKNYPPNFKYADFASQLKAEFFDAGEWADIINASGAR